MPEKKTFRVDALLAGKTVLRVLHDRGGLSHASARGLVAAGCVQRNGRALSRADERVAVGDRIELHYEAERRYHAPRAPRKAEGYRIVYEDPELVVADKEPGLLTVPVPSGRGGSLQEALADAYRARGQKDARVLPVHRIDRFTSGLVAFARTRGAWKTLREEFASGRPERIYLAVASGALPTDEGTLVHHLEENPRSLKVHVAQEGKRAALRYRVRRRFREATLLEVRLETGRRNQIRVQLASIGHPILGDRSYGEPSSLIERTALHATRLAFDHPTRRTRLAFDSPPPADFLGLLKRLEKAPRTDAHSPTSTRTPV